VINSTGSILQTINTQSTSLSYTVTGLTNGVARKFSVAAVNDIGDGMYSTESTLVTPVQAASVPGTPNTPSANPGNTQATVNWSGPSSNGSAISGYSIQVYRSGSFDRTVTTGSSGTSYTVTNLTSHTSYTFSVAAINGVGTGGYSAQSSAVTVEGVPGKPVIVSSQPYTDSASGSKSWRPVLNVPGGVWYPIIGLTSSFGLFNSARPANGYGGIELLSVSGTNYSLEIQTNGEIYGVNYTSYFVAYNSYGASPQSDPFVLNF
jgi:hypothetical protein